MSQTPIVDEPSSSSVHSVRGTLPVSRAMKQLAKFLPVVVALLLFTWVGTAVEPTYVLHRIELDNPPSEETIVVTSPAAAAELEAQLLEQAPSAIVEGTETAVLVERIDAERTTYSQLTVRVHYGFWSLVPAIVAIVCAWVTRDPLISLMAGIVCGALLLQQYDLTDEVLLQNLASTRAAGILLLYLWLLGGLMGIWSRTGAAKAFAETATRVFVRGPRTAKLVAWGLGILFFQGGTMSSVLVGTTVKPIADKKNVSHEELSYIVDSTSSPIACVLAFNAWPGYIQTLIFVPGLTWLATDEDRLSFFFASLPLSFYAIFAVTGTLLLTLDMAPLLGTQFREAIRRAREEGELNRPGSRPMSLSGLTENATINGYQPHWTDFCIPLILLTGVAIGTFLIDGSPQVRWAFGAALIASALLAMARGASLSDITAGLGDGMKSVVIASVILMLAVTMGSITQQTGGGVYLVDLLGTSTPHWLLPAILFLLAVAISFSTGTSWGTYAVAFPLAMPLAVAVGQSSGLAHEKLYHMICFASVLNGAVFGDQCSPISDTTILSAMTTGTDLMDHVVTQLVPASAAACLAVCCWTALAFWC